MNDVSNKVAAMNRRDFSKLSALTLAASQLRASAQQTSQKPIGFAPVGLGNISNTFMEAIANSKTCKVTGLVTGHPKEKGEKYSALYNVPKSSIYTYETYDRILDNKDIDAVYIGLPNSMHAEYTIRAAQAGKHVLCEKPMAISSAECRQMIDACKAHNVKLMIAYRLQYDPFWKKVKDMVAAGDIGDVINIHGGYWGYQALGAWRIDRKLSGGGSLMDLGIYPLNITRYILGEEPATFFANVATRDKQSGRFTTVEESVEWTMKFPSGVLASHGSTYAGRGGPSLLRINGNKGYLQLDACYTYDGAHLTGATTKGKLDEIDPGKRPFQFTNEAEHFAECVRSNRQPRTPGEEGLKDLIAIEAIYKAAGAPIA
jgi:predicted dehydrogenase